jgi:hypothetical protein
MPLLTELENLFFFRFYKDVTPTAFSADDSSGELWSKPDGRGEAGLNKQRDTGFSVKAGQSRCGDDHEKCGGKDELKRIVR